jgi:tetratricopeptide (TPR) repeat protein
LWLFCVLLLFLGPGCLPRATALKRKNIRKPGRKIQTTRRFSHSARAYYYYILGKTYSYQKKPAKAIKAFMQAILSDWDSPFLYYAVGREYLQQRNLSRARHWLEKALSKSKAGNLRPLAPALYLLARIHWRQGNMVKAERCYRRAIRSQPSYLNPYTDLLALLALKKNRLREQIRLSQAMIRYAPARYEGYLALATYLEKKGKHWLAIKAYRKALDRNPSHRKARYQVARLYERQRRWSRALTSYELLLDYHPGFRKARVLAASVRLKRGHRYDRSVARAQLRLMIRSLPKHRRAAQMRKVGYTLLRSRLPGEARRWLVKALRLKPGHPRTLWMLSQSWEQQKHYRMALKAIRRIQPANKKLSVRLMFRELKLLFKIGKVKVAKRLLKWNRSRYKHDLKTRLRLSQAFVSWATQKELSEEIAYFRKEFKRSMDNIGYLFHLSTLHYRKRAYPRTSRLLKKILKQRPDHAASLHFLATLYVKQKKHLPKAEQLMKRALKQQPNNGLFLDNYGWILYLRGKNKKAQQALTTARSLLPNSPQVLEHLGFLRRRQGRFRESLLLFYRARKLSTSKSARKRLLVQIRRLKRKQRARTRNKRKARRSKAS